MATAAARATGRSQAEEKKPKGPRKPERRRKAQQGQADGKKKGCGREANSMFCVEEEERKNAGGANVVCGKPR